MRTLIPHWCLSALIAFSTVGCASMRTTFFTRHEDDTLCKETIHPIHGVPVMVKVPTHLEIKVQETIHIVQHSQTADLQILNNSGRAIRTIEPSLRFTEKMFVVDPTRPFSGTASYGFTFRGGADKTGTPNAESGHGYLEKLRYTADDQSITNVTNLLANVAPLLGIGVANAESVKQEAKLHAVTGVQTTKRTIAYGLFDLNSPAFESDVTAFVETHINQCSPCTSDASSIHPAGIEFQKRNDPPNPSSAR